MEKVSLVWEVEGFDSKREAVVVAKSALICMQAFEVQAVKYHSGGYGVRGHRDIGLDNRPDAPYTVLWMGMLMDPLTKAILECDVKPG